MREILFRGKRLDNGTWTTGTPFFVKGRCKMIHAVAVHPDYLDEGDDGHVYYSEGYPVIPATVGQYTGLIDKNGKKIFEGDIVKLRLLAAKMEWKGVCEYRNGAFGLAWQYAGERYCTFAGTCNAEYEVLGNIHDNPELMEDE